MHSSKKIGFQGSPSTDMPDENPSEFVISDRYRWYVAWLLFAVYMLNLVDSRILIILMEPISLQLGFFDSQLGLLGGLAFAHYLLAARHLERESTCSSD